VKSALFSLNSCIICIPKTNSPAVSVQKDILLVCSGNVTCHHKNCTVSQTHVSTYLYYKKYSALNPNAIYREIFRSKYEIPI